LRELQVGTEPGLYLLKDFHPFLTDPIVIRALRSASGFAQTQAHLVIVSPVLQIRARSKRRARAQHPTSHGPDRRSSGPFLTKGKLI